MESFKNFLNNKYVRFLKNLYFLITFFFIVWMIFLDVNSFMFHNKLNKEVEDLMEMKKKLENDISKDQKLIEYLKKDSNYEAFARENFYMRRDNEDIYIIEFKDTLNK
ncbi:MAG: septum formation initiator [Flavobacteriales bacterium]|nr:septum formation initiator [Flavobacteriales bacterium]